MKKYLGLLLCGTLVLTGCTKIPKLQNGQEVVAEVDGKQFTAEDFYASMRENYGTVALVDMVDGFITEKELSEEQVKNIESEALVQFESYKVSSGENWEALLNYNGYTNETEFKEALISNSLKQEVLENYVKTTITDKEIEKYYKSDIYGEMTVRHILITPDVTDDMTDTEEKEAKEKALAEAKLLINQLSESKDLEKDFTELAKEKSDDTGSKKDGGLISNFTNESGLVEEFFDASYKLEVGKMTTEPVETQFGYHIIYKVSQKEKPALDTVKDTVISKLVTKKLSAENATYKYWAELRKKYNLTINDSDIKSVYNATISQYK